MGKSWHETTRKVVHSTKKVEQNYSIPAGLNIKFEDDKSNNWLNIYKALVARQEPESQRQVGRHNYSD